jgi:hypothetical protein
VVAVYSATLVATDNGSVALIRDFSSFLRFEPGDGTGKPEKYGIPL